VVDRDITAVSFNEYANADKNTNPVITADNIPQFPHGYPNLLGHADTK
jgi:hypothetical protein